MKKRINKKRVDNKDKIQNYFHSSVKYFKELKVYLIIVVILFFLSAFIGYNDLIGKFSPELSNDIGTEVMKQINEIIQQTEGMNAIELIGFIMTNNIKTSFFGAVFGIFFGILPVFILLFNGYILGFVAENVVNNPINGLGILVLWKLFPHGIFEIPAVLISIALGIKMGLFPFYLKDKKRGFFALVLSSIIFIFSLILITSIFLVISNPNILVNQDFVNTENSIENIMLNPVISIFYYLFMGILLIFSVYVGIILLNKEDKQIVIEIIKNSSLTFLFIVVPLLVVAGIIEGLLIVVMG